MNGYKTWTGLIIMVAGMLHLGKYFGDENIANVVNSLFELIGALIAAYGNWHAHKKIADLSKS